MTCALCLSPTEPPLCDGCRKRLDEGMKRTYVGGDVAKLAWLAERLGLGPETLLADAIKHHVIRSCGGEFVRGKPSPGLLRSIKGAMLEGFIEAKAQGRKFTARHARKSYGSPAAFRKALSRRKRDISGGSGEMSQKPDEREAENPATDGDSSGEDPKL